MTSPQSESLIVDGVTVTRVATARLPTRHGLFDIVAFENTLDRLEHIALVKGDVRGQAGVLVRLQSECLTGDALGSLRCDCRDQLTAAYHALGAEERGVLLYMRQEGRGIGLVNKVRAYALQDAGLDTIAANVQLGFAPDARRYEVAAGMLRLLAPASVVLLTNNPTKIDGLGKHGVNIERRRPIVSAANEHNAAYLRVKFEKMGHLG